jgi:hypothetical protein
MVDFRNQSCNHYFHQTDRSFADKDSRPSCALIIPTSSPILLFSFGTHEKGQHATRASRQETQIRHQDIPFDHRMRQEGRSCSQETNDLCSRRLIRCCFLYTERKGETHRCVEEREGSHDRHSERWRFLRRRLPCWAAIAPVLPQQQ